MNYKDKNVIVTGASGGMGRILCKRLKDQGAKLSVCSNDEAQMKELLNELGNDVFAKVIDITKENDVAAFFKESYEINGEYCALVNLAGLSIPGQISQTEENVYDLIMNVNVKGTFFTCKYFAQHTAEDAIIINIGSMAARNANGNAPLYCTAKASVNMLSQGLLLQLGKKNVRVTTVNPGGADTQFWGERPVDRSKLMKAEDVVDVLMFVLNSSPNVQIHDIYFESMAKFQ